MATPEAGEKMEWWKVGVMEKVNDEL